MTGAAHTKRPPADGRPQKLGWLRNGGTPGDLRSAKPCGAKTRKGTPCKGPAMANGRCRMHGGPSTGAKTPEGKAKCRLSNFKHGHYTNQAIMERRTARLRAREARQETAALLRLVREMFRP
jgi:hypothetical protein